MYLPHFLIEARICTQFTLISSNVSVYQQRRAAISLTVFPCVSLSVWLFVRLTVCLSKGGEIRDTKTLNLSRNMNKFVARRVASLMKNEQQSQDLLLKVDPRSTFRKNFLQRTKNVFAARKVGHVR